MAGWDNTMPTALSDGTLVDEAEMNPLLNNVTWLRYAMVFMGGVQRVTAMGSIVGVELAAMQSPAVTHENGYMYKIEGMAKIRSTVANDDAEIRLHQGAGIAGAVLQSFASPKLAIANAGYVIPFSVNVKSLATSAVAYTLGIRRLTGTGTLTVDTTSWLTVSRSGDNSLMTDV